MNQKALDNFQLDLGANSEMALAFILGLMMFAVALGLRIEHFRFFKEKPRVYLAGVFTQIIGLPLLTLGLCYLINPYPSIALGMILIACCPGGNTSNLLVLFARGNTALSVSLTATSSLAAAFITPVSILFWCSLYPPTRNLLTEINFDVSRFLTQTLIILGLPLLLGMLIAWRAPTLSRKLQKPLSLLAGLGLILIILGACMKYVPIFLKMGPPIFVLVILHNALAFGLGYFAGKLTGADKPSRRALTFEVGIQNSGLGIVILLTQFGGLGGAGVVAGLWGAWHIIGGLMLVTLYRYNDKRAG